MRRAVLLGIALLVGCGPLVLGDEHALGPLPAQPQTVPVDQREARVELGRLLFWDPILSGDRDVACASCHHPDLGYADGRARGLGTGAHGLGPLRTAPLGVETLPLNTPTVLDTAYNGLAHLDDAIVPEEAPMFWDSRTRSLEAQAEGPLLAASEMRGSLREDEVFDELSARLSAIDEYSMRFEQAYGSVGIDRARIVSAIAAFERTLVIEDSSFDRFLAGDDAALSLPARRGLVTFFAAGCASCHSGPMLSDYELHDLGVGAIDPATGERQRIRTPSLRSAALTAPYMHDGSVATLEGAVSFYTGLDASLDPDLAGNRPLGPGSAADIARFLESLGDGTFDTQIPDAVPSGLAVGGAIDSD